MRRCRRTAGQHRRRPNSAHSSAPTAAASPASAPSQCLLDKVVGWLLSREGQANQEEADATTNGVDSNVKRFTQRAFCYLYAYPT